MTPQEVAAKVGEHFATSEWVEMSQERINQFADATGDHQFIHINEEAAKMTPFGGTIAHGFLTLSLLPAMADTAFAIDDVRMGVNYGLNRVRFVNPVAAGSRVRGHFKLLSYEPLEGGAQLTIEVSMELEGAEKPACVAQSVSRRYT